MNILVVGNIVKDIYLNLDSRSEALETDKNNVKWLNLSFDASKHYFFNRTENYGGAAVSLEVLQKLGLSAGISGSRLNFVDDNLENDIPEFISDHRYILINDEKVTYFTPSAHQPTVFKTPDFPVDYLYLDRSAELSPVLTSQILDFLSSSENTKLILYAHDLLNPELSKLLPYAELVFAEENPSENPAIFDAPKTVYLSENRLSYLEISESISVNRVDVLTHLSAYSIAAATILGNFIRGCSVEESLEFARLNVENSKLNSSLSLAELESLKDSNDRQHDDLELIAASLLIHPKGILAADESGGSIKKKFATLNIPDVYENRRDYRNLFFTTDHLEDYVSGIILFDETARSFADNSQNVVDFLTSRRIIPGIKVDQGLENFENSEETYTKGLEGLETRLAEYHHLGLRFAKWRAAFEIRLDESGNLKTPTDLAVKENCRILADYARACQDAHIVPIVEPEVVHDGNYPIELCAETTSAILDQLFISLAEKNVNLRACILKVNMILAGKQFETGSTPEEVGLATAEVLKNHVPSELAGVVFLSGGQTPEQSTNNLAAVLKNGPFPWPVTFSFARALQDPALYAWAGNNKNGDAARAAFLARLKKNQEALL